MRRGNLTEQACNRTSQGRITCDAGQVCLMIGEWPQTRGEELLLPERPILIHRSETDYL